MFDFFDHCIFCGTALPDSRSGEGEHVFPDGIYGFWRSYDVCVECQQALGKEVDVLATRDLSLLNAMELLKLKDTNPNLDNLAWQGEDTLDRRKVPMVKRGHKMRVKVSKTHDFLECSEDDLQKLAKPWLRGLLRPKFSEQEFEAEYRRFMDAYRNLSPGEKYESEVFGYSIRRRQTTNVRVENPTPADFTRLVAKIAVYFIHYALPRLKLSTVQEVQMLRDHARHGEPLKPFTILRQRTFEDELCHPFHRVAVSPSDLHVMVDISIFANIHWRIVLHTSEPLILKDNDGRQAHQFLFILDFKDLSDRHKYVGFKYNDEEDVVWSEVQG
jgi:hypothetical protein